MGSVQAPPTKACHNCRRQRLRCDRSYPHCNKCTSAGKECLGYGKLFRWTGSIASRGKLAGRTSSGPLGASEQPPSSPGSEGSCSVRGSPTPPRELGAAVGGTINHRPFMDVGARGNGMQLVPHVRPLGGGAELGTPWVLVDPVFQDFNPSHRYYLNYFTSRLCQDLVSHDLPDTNPFRMLLPLTKSSPLLQYIIVASSAAHMSNLLRIGMTSAKENDVAAITFNREQASARALHDSLVAKQKALRLMHAALQDIDGTGGDIVLAASLFFINVELIESGKHGWRAHLEGASKIMALLPATKAWNSVLRDYLLSDCFIYFILGSAFMPATHATALNFESSQIPFILGKTVANSYLCCPPEIMETLHAASQLSNLVVDETTVEAVTDTALDMLTRVQAVDIETWVRDSPGVASQLNYPINSRMHAGAVHRLAACLYILQAIPSVAARVPAGLGEQLNREIFEHLAKIPDDDPNFKATTWPTFIVGAESTDPAKQEWIMERFRRLVTICPWGFIYTAMDTLQVIWSLDAEARKSRSWVQTLKDPALNFLIV